MTVSVLTALLVGFLCCLPGQTLAQDDPYYKDNTTCDRFVDMAIVGAGHAGIYSAYKLRLANLKVEILEYTNRTGGRIFTKFLPGVDVPLELGEKWFIGGKDQIVERLVRELGLTTTPQELKPEEKKYYIRGETFTEEEIKYKPLPFDLTPEEKANQADLPLYYLKKLTKFNDTILRPEQVLTLKLEDGRPLYELTIHEALDLVASPDGKELLRAVGIYYGLFAPNASAVEYFYTTLEKNLTEQNKLAIKGGMSLLPQTLLTKFLDASIKHKLSLNKKLESILLLEDKTYMLVLKETITVDGLTFVTKNVERLCAKKVILALPQRALIELEWKPLKTGKVLDALTAVLPIKTSNVYLTFSNAWWLTDLVQNKTTSLITDLPFNAMCDWKKSSTGEAIMLASFADSYRAEFFENLNLEGKPIIGSAFGVNKVSTSLKDELLIHLAQALDVPLKKVPEPLKGISQFWSLYPYYGGLTIWKAGYHHDEVRLTIQHPSLIDDVYVVGPDYALTMTNLWTEAALETVEEVFEKFLIF